jgi:uncharacterized protein (DUF885 family)
MSLALIAAAALSAVQPASNAAKPVPATASLIADRELAALADAYDQASLDARGMFLDAEGESQAGPALPRVDGPTQERRAARSRALLTRLEAISPARLSEADRVNAAVLRTVLEAEVADARFREWEMPVNSDSNFWTYLDRTERLADAAAYRRYIGRMRDVPRYFAEQTANLDAGLKRGFTPPAVTLAGRDSSIEAYLKVPPENAFFAAFRTMPATMPAAEQALLRAEAQAAIREAVIPAYRRRLDYWRTRYVPGARRTLAARDLPEGDAYYRAQVREYTTLALTPEQIHAIGLAEVARIAAEMKATMTETGFKGDFPAFLAHIRSDSRFIARTPDELLGVSAYAAKRVDGKIGDYFAVLPRRRYTIIPVPDALARFYTAGRGGLNSCQMNTHDLPSRPLVNIPALTLHECAPGHSFQAALAAEGPALPRFRRSLYFSGYGEGWGLYSEWLGIEMGIYRTPYERFGQQSYAMWRAARLVIDTGIHLHGWSRERAIDYLASHTALSTHEVATEVDRYISWPGQALAYKLGELEIRRLRSEAERELGAAFDIKAFHSMILGLGSVPLAELQTQVRGFVATQKAKARPAT